MYSSYLKINKKYIHDFSQRVRSGLLSLDIVSDSSFLKVMLKEINWLFRILSGRLTSTRQIPKPNDLPSSDNFNKFLQNIDIDLDKLYISRQMIESDAQNVANFNSLERVKASNKLIKAHSKVYSQYIKVLEYIDGELIIREDFDDEGKLVNFSDVQLNTNIDTLRLSVQDTVENRDAIETNTVACRFVDPYDEDFNLFPNTTELSIGSFWKRSSSDRHWYRDIDSKYKINIIDKPESEYLNSCQFESVLTIYDNSLSKIKEEVGEYTNLHHSFVFMDRNNSLHGQYLYAGDNDDIDADDVKLLLTMPIDRNSTSLCSSIDMLFEPNDGNILPSIDIEHSYVEDIVGRKFLFDEIISDDENNNETVGFFKLPIKNNEPILPHHITLTLTTPNAWPALDKYYLAEYKYSNTKQIDLDVTMNNEELEESISVSITKDAYVYVDAEYDPVLEFTNERDRAFDVLQQNNVGDE